VVVETQIPAVDLTQLAIVELYDAHVAEIAIQAFPVLFTLQPVLYA
jgi:hypothetical protein